MNYFNVILRMLKWSISSTAIGCFLAAIFCLINKSGKKFTFGDAVSALLLVVVSSFRYDVGSDYFRYMESAAFASRKFADLHKLFNASTLSQYNFEVGYETISVLSSRVFHSKFAIFWMVSILLYVPLVYYCRKCTDNAKIALSFYILFGFWGLSLNILKQALAMMFILMAYEALKNHRYILFVCVTIVASSFHITAVVAALCILVVHLKLFHKLLMPTKRNLYFMVAVGVALRLMTAVFASVLRHLGVFTQYLFYLEAGNGDSTSRNFILYGAFLETVLVFGILYSAIQNLDRLRIINRNIEMYISIIMVGIPFSIIGVSKTLWLANRFAKFFFLFLLVLVPAMASAQRVPKGIPKSVPDKIAALLFKPCLVNTHFSLSLSVFSIVMIGWHAMYSVLMMDNNRFNLQTYLFGIPK